MLQLLGFIPAGIPSAPADSIPADVHALAAEREVARTQGNWAQADVLRRQIAERGFLVEDRAGGPRLKPIS